MEEDAVVLASEFGGVGKVKYPGVGKKTHYVFEGLLGDLTKIFTDCVPDEVFWFLGSGSGTLDTINFFSSIAISLTCHKRQNTIGDIWVTS